MRNYSSKKMKCVQLTSMPPQIVWYTQNWLLIPKCDRDLEFSGIKIARCATSVFNYKWVALSLLFSELCSPKLWAREIRTWANLYALKVVEERRRDIKKNGYISRFKAVCEENQWITWLHVPVPVCVCVEAVQPGCEVGEVTPGQHLLDLLILTHWHWNKRGGGEMTSLYVIK